LCSRNALPVVLKDFASRDPQEMADLSGALYRDNTIILQYCNLPLAVNYPRGEINFLERGKNSTTEENLQEKLSTEEKVVILQYLTRASGLPVRGQWLSFLDLRGGPLHWKPFQKEALEPLAKKYYSKKDQFLKLAFEHGGSPLEQGDAGVVIPVFPRIPLAFILWEGDEEFAPRSTILYDSVAETYLDTAGLYVLGIQAVIRVWFPGDTRFT
jgi:hypothetical protein